jgi:Flp pilus assembly protein TadG
MTMKSNRSTRQRGGATMEFALGLPLLLFMMFGVVQVGAWMGNYVVLTRAASAAARLLASERGFSTPYTDTFSTVTSMTAELPGTPTVIVEVVNSSTTTCAGTSANTTCASALGTISQPPAAGTMANVSISYKFVPPFGGSLYGLASIMPSTLSASASVVVQ